MATFTTNNSFIISTRTHVTHWKFHIRNKTKSTSVLCNWSMCDKSKEIDPVAGTSWVTANPGEEHSYNFDLRSAEPPDHSAARSDPCYPNKDDWPTLTFNTKSMIPVTVYSRFWNTGRRGLFGLSDLRDFNINMLAKDKWRVTTDTNKFNAIEGYGYRVTVDAGGKKQDTLHIFYQIYGD